MIQPLKTPSQSPTSFTRDVGVALRRANRKVWQEAANLGHKLAITDGGGVKLVQPRGVHRKNRRLPVL
jgi:hypothetical protein